VMGEAVSTTMREKTGSVLQVGIILYHIIDS